MKFIALLFSALFLFQCAVCFEEENGGWRKRASVDPLYDDSWHLHSTRESKTGLRRKSLFNFCVSSSETNNRASQCEESVGDGLHRIRLKFLFFFSAQRLLSLTEVVFLLFLFQQKE